MTIPLPIDRYFGYVIAIETERALRDFAENRDQDVTPPAVHFHRGSDPAIDVSIVIPVWNPQEAHFSRCLASLKQADFTGLNHEIIVSDDASSGDVAKTCVDRAALRGAIYVRQSTNLGGFGNFNWCIGAARGRWIHLLHQDDWVEPGFYRELLSGAASESGAQLRYCRTKLFHEEAGETRLMFDEAPMAGILEEFFQRQCVSQRMQIVGAIMAREAVANLGGYDARLGTGADWEFWVRWASKYKVYYSPRTLATFCVHRASWNSREESFAGLRLVLQRILCHVAPAQRRQVAAGFLTNMVSRLLGIAAQHRKARALHLNQPIAGALLVGCKEAGLLPDIEKILAAGG